MKGRRGFLSALLGLVALPRLPGPPSFFQSVGPDLPVPTRAFIVNLETARYWHDESGQWRPLRVRRHSLGGAGRRIRPNWISPQYGEVIE